MPGRPELEYLVAAAGGPCSAARLAGVRRQSMADWLSDAVSPRWAPTPAAEAALDRLAVEVLGVEWAEVELDGPSRERIPRPALVVLASGLLTEVRCRG